MVLHTMADLRDACSGGAVSHISSSSCDILRSFQSTARLAGDCHRFGRLPGPGRTLPLLLDRRPGAVHQAGTVLLHGHGAPTAAAAADVSTNDGARSTAAAASTAGPGSRGHVRKPPRQ